MPHQVLSFLLALIISLLSGCAVPAKTYEVLPSPVQRLIDPPASKVSVWYIVGVERDIGGLCPKSAPCTILILNRNQRAEGGALVPYPKSQLNGLLQSFGVKRTAELIGRKVTGEDITHPCKGLLVQLASGCPVRHGSAC